jgi:hypothetical protein
MHFEEWQLVVDDRQTLQTIEISILVMLYQK